jgi:hypothetical protein
MKSEHAYTVEDDATEMRTNTDQLARQEDINSTLLYVLELQHLSTLPPSGLQPRTWECAHTVVSSAMRLQPAVCALHEPLASDRFYQLSSLAGCCLFGVSSLPSRPARSTERDVQPTPFDPDLPSGTQIPGGFLELLRLLRLLS